MALGKFAAEFMRKRVRIGLIFGGISPEHDVSICSAAGVRGSIDASRFDVWEIYIDRQGRMFYGRDLLMKLKDGGKQKFKKLLIDRLPKMIDVAFPVLHGEGGEDGSIQGFLKTLRIPYVGCGLLASAVCLDKAVLNELLVSQGILKPKCEVLDFQREGKSICVEKVMRIKRQFKFPLFVKPARTGSSVGISKVKNGQALSGAIHKARKFDNKIVVEESVENCLEIEVSVLGGSVNDYAVSLPGRVLPAAEFYDYADKYKNNQTGFEVPARLSAGKTKEIQLIALAAYKIANCTGLARVDFLLDKKQRVFLNEINTLPGFTPISMYSKLWAASGLSYSRLITKLILLAMTEQGKF